MGFQIIPVDAHKNDDILEYICKHLWSEWENKYYSLWGFTTVKNLISFYKNSPNITLYAAINDQGEFIGCYSLMSVKYDIWLNDVVVPVKHRGKGIGKRLVEYAIRNQYNVMLNTDKEMTSFYQKIGFQIVSYNTMKGWDGKEYNYYTMEYEAKNYDIYMYLMIAIVIVSIIFICITIHRF